MSLATRRVLYVRMVPNEPRVRRMGTAMKMNVVSLGLLRTRVMVNKIIGMVMT
jgi:hypothetical protein